jgi:hypothetical protein
MTLAGLFDQPIGIWTLDRHPGQRSFFAFRAGDLVGYLLSASMGGKPLADSP